MAETTLNIIHTLRKENEELRRELRERCIERDAALEKAVSMMHELTYASELVNRKGLVAVKCES